MRVKGALHEFAVVKGVKEDVASLLLNLKKIRLKMFTAGPETVVLRVKKEGVVTAKNIEPNSISAGVPSKLIKYRDSL